MLDEQEQRAIAGGLQSGCRESWAKLYDAYSVDVWRYVARLIGSDAAVVADVVQETFIEAARSAASFDQSRGALSSWLVGIAHHRVAAHWRQAARIARLQKLVEQRADEIRHWLDAAAPVGQPSERQELAEFAELVRATLAELPADYAALLTAKYVDDRELVALAADTSSSVDAVKSKLARARRDFRAKFERLTREPTQSMIE